MRTLATLFLFLLLLVSPIYAEYEDLRTPQQGGEQTFTGSWSSCASCSLGLSKSETRKAAIQIAKNKARASCREAGANGVLFLDITTTRIPHAHNHHYVASVRAQCVVN